MSDVHVSFASKLISEGHGTRLGKYSLGKVSPRLNQGSPFTGLKVVKRDIPLFDFV